MTIHYTYTITRVDAAARCMDVVFESPGRQSVAVCTRIPRKGESIDLVLDPYAPIGYWEELDQDLEIPEVGSQGASGVASMVQVSAPEFTSDLTTVAQVRERRLRDIANWRYQQEVGGIDLNGSLIRTDRESQAAIGNAYSSLKNGLVDRVSWKTGDGTWVELTEVEISVVASAVARHVRDCFDAEKELVEQLDQAMTGISDVPGAIVAANSVVLP